MRCKETGSVYAWIIFFCLILNDSTLEVLKLQTWNSVNPFLMGSVMLGDGWGIGDRRIHYF